MKVVQTPPTTTKPFFDSSMVWASPQTKSTWAEQKSFAETKYPSNCRKKKDINSTWRPPPSGLPSSPGLLGSTQRSTRWRAPFPPASSRRPRTSSAPLFLQKRSGSGRWSCFPEVRHKKSGQCSHFTASREYFNLDIPAPLRPPLSGPLTAWQTSWR